MNLRSISVYEASKINLPYVITPKTIKRGVSCKPTEDRELTTVLYKVAKGKITKSTTLVVNRTFIINTPVVFFDGGKEIP